MRRRLVIYPRENNYLMQLKQPFYIGLTGLARSGKNTAGVHLRQLLYAASGNNFPHLGSFAAPLKKCYETIYGEEYQDTDEWKSGMAPFGGLTRRQALQGIGHGLREILGDSVWLDAFFSEAEKWVPGVWIITDVRYPNEVDEIIKRGGVVYRVHRDGTAEMNHPSEQILKHRVFPVILNNGTINDLRINCQQVADSIIKQIEASCL